MKISCSSWSYHRILKSDVYRPVEGGRLSQIDWVKKCNSELEIDGVELGWGHFPSTDKDYLRDLKKIITEEGLTIAAVSVGNHFTGSDDNKMREEVAKVKKWTGIAAYLGAPIVRCLAGSGEELRVRGIMDKTALCLRECATYASEFGIILGIENHGGTTAEQILKLIKKAETEWLKLVLDVGNFPFPPYASIKKCMPYAILVHAKTYKFDETGNETKLDYEKIFSILKEWKYNGFLSLEYEGEEEEESMVPRSMCFLKKLQLKYEM